METVYFNQDCTSLAVSSKCGYQLYSLGNVNQCEINQFHVNDTNHDLYIVERLFNSSLIALVSLQTPTYLKICHFKKNSEICKYGYSSKILSVKLNRKILIVCLVDQYSIHCIRDMKVMQTLESVCDNPAGLCALSTPEPTALMAFPNSEQTGSFTVYDGLALELVMKVDAHTSPLAAIAFSNKADMIATASVKGTVIRTFSAVNGDKLLEFRRGLKRCVTISSLAFSPDGLYLASCSNTETVHVFKIPPCEEKEETSLGWTGYLTSAITSSAVALIPSTVSNAYSAWRAYATARLSDGGKRTICGIIAIKNVVSIVVADEEGLVHVFELDTKNGGECNLVMTKRLDMFDVEKDVENNEKITNTSEKVSSESLLHCDKTISDASYAYKLKSEKRLGPATTSQELNEIVDNVSAMEAKEACPDLLAQIKLDDPNEFPPMTQ